MKKRLLAIIAALAIGTAAMAQFTTSAGGDEFIDLSAKSSRTFTRQWYNIGTPFVATDVYGNTVRLQDFLDSGKFVVIDYSCTWCGPCWNLHTSGMLEQINALQDFQVIWVEIESSNTTQQIFGPRGGSGYASSTQGDWTHNANGDSITYPIIDDDANRSCLSTCVRLYTGSVPTLMLITPYGQYINLSGYFSYQQVSQSITNIRSIANSAPRPGSAPQCKIDGGSTSTITGYPASLKALVNTVDPVSISWTFDGGTPATDTGYNVTTRFGSNGTHRVILTVTNANGTDHDTINITSRSLPANAISYSFGSSYVTGIGGSTAAQRYWAVSFPPEYLTNFPQVHHVEYYVKGQYSGAYTMKVCSGTTTEPQTELGSTTLNVTSSMGTGYMKFDLPNPIPVDPTKTLWIVMSANSTFPVSACAYTCNPNSNWISTDGTTWKHINEAMSSGTNYSWLLNVYSSVNGISLASDNEISVYPNPATDNVTIMADGVRYVDVIDMNGTTVMKVNDAKTINLENLSSGVYVFRVVTDNGVAMRKVVKK